MRNETQIVPLRIIRFACCGYQKCWVNPRLPMYCPECGKKCYPVVKEWIMYFDKNAILKYKVDD